MTTYNLADLVDILVRRSVESPCEDQRLAMSHAASILSALAVWRQEGDRQSDVMNTESWDIWAVSMMEDSYMLKEIIAGRDTHGQSIYMKLEAR
jgi:hypothetical protein